MCTKSETAVPVFSRCFLTSLLIIEIVLNIYLEVEQE